MSRQFYKDALGWGFGLWLVGYVLGFVLFFVVPASLIGWVILPIGTLITLWVLLNKIHGTLAHFALVGAVWAFIAIVCDYVFLVQLLHPMDGYYKLDVFVYYLLTLALPVSVGWWRTSTAP